MLSFGRFTPVGRRGGDEEGGGLIMRKTTEYARLASSSVADPEFFSEMGLPTPGGQGSQTYDFAKCSQKLHEIERIWALRGGASPKFYYVDPPLQLIRCCPLSTGLISLFMHINEQG